MDFFDRAVKSRCAGSQADSPHLPHAMRESDVRDRDEQAGECCQVFDVRLSTLLIFPALDGKLLTINLSTQLSIASSNRPEVIQHAADHTYDSRTGDQSDSR